MKNTTANSYDVIIYKNVNFLCPCIYITENNQTISNEQKEIFIKQIDDLEHKLRENEAILKTENNLISSSNQIFNIIKESKNTIIMLKEMLNDSKTEHLLFNDKLTNFKSTLLNLFGSINLYTSYLEKYKLNKENFDVVVSFINTKPHLIDNQIIKDFINKYNEFKSIWILEIYLQN
ncbi:hypothetical protein NW731_03735 [Mycoplasmopsis felis]|uniref:hypothetical protein n=1 Tax=Mycoplasmopsis felis TaxID=33923 RepID=UPI0021DFBE8D|nr:hypothetical protein [Mycoplasmopsis felis]MCU9937544.1 hypothetical protein [Mycoplasmopsis felis]